MKNKRFFPLGIGVILTISAALCILIFIIVAWIIIFSGDSSSSSNWIYNIIIFFIGTSFYLIFLIFYILRFNVHTVKFEREYMQLQCGTLNKPNSKIKYKKSKLYYYDIIEISANKAKSSAFEKKVIDEDTRLVFGKINIICIKLQNGQQKVFTVNYYSKRQMMKILDEIKARVNSAGNKLNYSSKALVNELNDIKEEDYAPLE